MAEKYLTKSFFITTPTGEKKQVKVRAKTKKELEKKFMEKKLGYEMGILTINSNTLFSKWAEEWLETYKKPTVTDATLVNIRYIIDKFFTPRLHAKKLSDIKTIHIQQCLNESKDYAKSTIDKAFTYINSIMEKAVVNNLINRNPCLGVEKPKGKEKQERRALTEEERAIFKKTMAQHEKGLIFGIMLACGLRPSEARALKWGNIDIKNKQLNITAAVEKGKSTLKPPKSKAGIRTVPIPNWYMEIFTRKIIPNINKDEFIFFGCGSKPMTKQRLQRAWSSFLREMDITAGAKLYRNKVIEHAIDQSITPYYLRHTYATSLAENSIDMKTAQYLLGHSSIEMTAHIYTHVTNRMLETAREKINEM